MNKIYKKIRLCDQIMMDEFTNMVVIDEQGGSHPVPLVWSSDVRMPVIILAEGSEEPRTDRIKLPIMNIHLWHIDPPSGLDGCCVEMHYKLSVWTMFEEEANQLVEQILLKLTPVAFTSKLGYHLPIRLHSIYNNLDSDESRIIHHMFDLGLEVDLQTLEEK